jgi:hypothetical protein
MLKNFVTLRISSLEKKLNQSKEDNIKLQKDLLETAKKSDSDERKITQTVQEFNKLKNECEKLIVEKDQLRREVEIERMQNLEVNLFEQSLLIVNYKI